jgi:hypothetical protein
MMTVKEFLKTVAAAEAAEQSGNCNLSDFSPDGYHRVALHFSGYYTVPEVKSLLRDLERVQAAYDVASCGV